MSKNGCFTVLKTCENVRNYAHRKSATAGLCVGALLLQICDCKTHRVKIALYLTNRKNKKPGEQTKVKIFGRLWNKKYVAIIHN